ncbi:DNA-processing protein DprA [Nocardia sp. FBN12]|uniref:DNA-processing protein DprA n=1 Tax=Nocardia sp. FBN12 TaxID=3419766 RepID=UPI003D031B05
MSPTRADQERAAFVALIRMRPKLVEWSAITEQVFEAGGSALAVWEELNQPNLLGPGDYQDVFDQAVVDLQHWEARGYRLHTFRDRTYPRLLRSVRNPPPVVFTQGQTVSDERGVCIVGSRAVSDLGLRFAREVARGAVEANLSVISGLALGVDTAAHVTALEAGGRTVAVLGNGLGRVYPRPNAALQSEIARRGMLLSHFLPDFTANKWSFPARNITMSAFGLATVIVEAGEKSGTRHQAREANQHGRPLILTTSVVRTTSWGRDLADKPGVAVVTTPAEAVEQAAQIAHRQAVASSWLADAIQ